MTVNRHESAYRTAVILAAHSSWRIPERYSAASLRAWHSRAKGTSPLLSAQPAGGPFLERYISTTSFDGAMESTDIADSLKDAQELGADRWVAVYIAVLAVFLSICTVGGG